MRKHAHMHTHMHASFPWRWHSHARIRIIYKPMRVPQSHNRKDARADADMRKHTYNVKRITHSATARRIASSGLQAYA